MGRKSRLRRTRRSTGGIMNGASFILCCVIACLWSSASEALPCSSAEESKQNGSKVIIHEDSTSSTHWLEPIHGLKVNYGNSEIIIKYSPSNSQDSKEQGRDGQNGEQRTKGVLKKIGKFMMMIPIGLQLLQLPMAIASVKMSLIKSILVAKVAIFLLLLKYLFSTLPKQKIVVVRAPPKETHEHYYHPFEDPEDSKPGWLGKAPAWME